MSVLESESAWTVRSSSLYFICLLFYFITQYLQFFLGRNLLNPLLERYVSLVDQGSRIPPLRTNEILVFLPLTPEHVPFTKEEIDIYFYKNTQSYIKFVTEKSL